MNEKEEGQNNIDDELVLWRKPTHSDYLIHWTGSDLVRDRPDFRISARSYDDDLVEAFLKRLYEILKYGFWLTKSENPGFIKIKGNQNLKKPNVARLCFTELRLSDSLLHAKKFGGLGIGVKRYYLFSRFGAPMHYVHDEPNLFLPPYSSILSEESEDYELLSFVKNMSSGRNRLGYIDYDLYEESEWRIIFSEKIKSKLKKNGSSRYFIDPKCPEAGRYYDYYQELSSGNRLEYLTPLDEWVALIIYPNLQVKNAAYQHKGIREELAKLKSRDKLTGKIPKINPILSSEVVNQVVEIDMGSIKQF